MSSVQDVPKDWKWAVKKFFENKLRLHCSYFLFGHLLIVRWEVFPSLSKTIDFLCGGWWNQVLHLEIQFIMGTYVLRNKVQHWQSSCKRPLHTITVEKCVWKETIINWYNLLLEAASSADPSLFKACPNVKQCQKVWLLSQCELLHTK